MRVLLTSNASHVPPRGGSTRSNLLWLQHLAAQGHTCEVVAASAERDSAQKREQVRAELSAIGAGDTGTDVTRRDGLTIYSIEEPSRRGPVLRERIQALQPDWVLVSSEDLGHTLLREAQRSAPGRVVYVAHTPQFYPFGPAAWNPDPHATDLVRQAAGVVAIGRHTAGYIAQHSGALTAVVHPPLYGAGPWPDFHNFRDGFVLMINPCAVKGISIFLDVAAAMPDVPFAALNGWGTTQADRDALSQRSNVTLLPNVKEIDQVLMRTRLLLMPSLWYEGFGLIVMEAMLRGIPVIASDAGGLVEAKQGTDGVIPVRAIEEYEPVFDEVHMPRPVVQPQEIAPWVQAIRERLGDAKLYEQEAVEARRVSQAFVAQLHAGQMEEYLLKLTPREVAPVVDIPTVAGLSPEKRALLLRRLRQHRT